MMAAHYLFSHEEDPWMDDVKWATDASGHNYIRAFRFLVGMRDISSTTNQQEATSTFREVAARYPAYNVTTFMPLWLFTDQYALVVPNTVQDIIIAVLCMLFIAFLLIPQPFCALWVAFTIGSIDLGVLGYMTLWDVNLVHYNCFFCCIIYYLFSIPSLDFYGSKKSIFQVHSVTALARNGGNILDHEFAEAVFRLDQYIQNRLEIEIITFLYFIPITIWNGIF
uniref:SSD domain-containing protein n=1 Tax=Heterorhabditis bacteriophora TaxID=37862 RepID=A0A1I7XNZ1_HETBA